MSQKGLLESLIDMASRIETKEYAFLVSMLNHISTAKQ